MDEIMKVISPEQILIGLCLCGFVAYWLLELAPWEDIVISVSKTASGKSCHGVVFAQSDKGVELYGFIVDKKSRLLYPQEDTLKELFRQLRQLQLNPIAIEVSIGVNVATYYPDSGVPAIVHPAY